MMPCFLSYCPTTNIVSKVADGLYVGDLCAAHHLFDDLRHHTPRASPPGFEQIDAREGIKGVITACFDVPDWCSHSPVCFHSADEYSSPVLDELLKSRNLDRSYVSLHVDRITHFQQKSPKVVGADPEPDCTYVVHAVIKAEDSCEERLFRAFSFTYDFVEAVRSVAGGSTFVHCMMGMSRSCTLVASYMMRRQDEVFTKVIEQLRHLHPIASPSLGFICQLVLYHKYGFEIQSNTMFWTEYRHLLRNVDLQHLEEYESRTVVPREEDEQKAVYSCMKCRQTLFYGHNVIHHANVDCERNPSCEPCSSVFVEPMDWMSDMDAQTGKISCKNARCASKLGYYCWYGRRCSCGHLQAPAFQIQLSKVDKLLEASRLGGRAPNRNDSLL